MNILVTGGAGYIGSAVGEELMRAGHHVVAYDNLSKGHRGAVVEGVRLVEGDISSARSLKEAFHTYQIDAVVHMAASSLVGESVSNPHRYYCNNVGSGLVLLESMLDLGVRRIVFSSTAAVYGDPVKQPIEESDPTNPTNPYGESKLAFERALHWYERAYGLRYVSLRYFNAAGATTHCGESHDPETHLIPIVLDVALGKREYVEIYGDDYATRDGTCVRDYIHVTDLGRAHMLALENIDDHSGVYNLGSSPDGCTVREVIDAARLVTGQDIAFRTVSRRPGDPAVLIACSQKARRELNWTPEMQDVGSIIESAWRWIQAHPGGYEHPTLRLNPALDESSSEEDVLSIPGL